MKSRGPQTIHCWQMTRDGASADGSAPAYTMERQMMEVPELRHGEVLVQIAGCGVCGTDIGYFYHGIPTVRPNPIELFKISLPGKEGAKA